MPDCPDPIADENIDFCPTTETAAGVSETQIYAAYLSDFETLNAPPALTAATTYTEAATIIAAHTFATGKGFFKINVLPDTGLVESTLVGEKGSKSYSSSFSGTLSGTSARNKGFGRLAKNAPMVFLVVQTNGDIVQLGSETRGAYFEEFNATSGAKAEDVNGITFKITDVQSYPAPNYTHTITEFTPA